MIGVLQRYPGPREWDHESGERPLPFSYLEGSLERKRDTVSPGGPDTHKMAEPTPGDDGHPSCLFLSNLCSTSSILKIPFQNSKSQSHDKATIQIHNI